MPGVAPQVAREAVTLQHSANALPTTRPERFVIGSLCESSRVS